LVDAPNGVFNSGSFSSSLRQSRVGVLVEDLANLRLQLGSGDEFPDDLPPVLKDTVARLRVITGALDESEKSRATRALAHLYKLLQSHDATGGRDL